MRDYVLNPTLRSNSWRKIEAVIQSKIGRKASVQIPSNLGMLVVWILMGLWHGGDWKYIAGMSMWFWLCNVLARLFNSVFKKASAY